MTSGNITEYFFIGIPFSKQVNSVYHRLKNVHSLKTSYQLASLVNFLFLKLRQKMDKKKFLVHKHEDTTWVYSIHCIPSLFLKKLKKKKF